MRQRHVGATRIKALAASTMDVLVMTISFRGPFLSLQVCKGKFTPRKADCKSTMCKPTNVNPLVNAHHKDKAFLSTQTIPKISNLDNTCPRVHLQMEHNHSIVFFPLCAYNLHRIPFSILLFSLLCAEVCPFL